MLVRQRARARDGMALRPASVGSAAPGRKNRSVPELPRAARRPSKPWGCRSKTLTPTPEPAGYCAGDVAGERGDRAGSLRRSTRGDYWHSRSGFTPMPDVHDHGRDSRARRLLWTVESAPSGKPSSKISRMPSSSSRRPHRDRRHGRRRPHNQARGQSSGVGSTSDGRTLPVRDGKHPPSGSLWTNTEALEAAGLSE